jgi:hypothetical protein
VGISHDATSTDADDREVFLGWSRGLAQDDVSSQIGLLIKSLKETVVTTGSLCCLELKRNKLSQGSGINWTFLIGIDFI